MQFAHLGNVEFQLTAYSCSRSGWSGDRATLSDELLNDLRVSITEIIRRPVSPSLVDLLCLIVANTTAAELARQRYRQGLQKANVEIGLFASVQSGQTAKLSTLALVRLKGLEKHYLRLCGDETLDQFKVHQYLATLTQDPIVSALLDRCVRSRGGPSYRIWGHSRYEFQVFFLLEQAFADAKVFLQQSVKPGRSEPVYEQLVRALRGWYEEATGKTPRRSYDGCKTKDVGPFLEFCRRVAAVVNGALPVDLQRIAMPDMARSVRRMIEEQDAELEASTKN